MTDAAAGDELDDEDDAIETGALGVENRVVDDEMAGLVDRLDLFEAPEAYRSLSRPSSAPDAKAFPLRSF